jgi:D-cysteine desulfhydrase
VAELPLVRRFPALSEIPRAAFGTFPTPVERVALGDGRTMLVKRDDLSAGRRAGGNKIRALEWLMGDVEHGDRVVTVGARGSSHALATALCARRRGASATVVRWNQEMNDAARRVDARVRKEARVIDARYVPLAFAMAGVLRAGGDRWIPAGGASPRAALGHVNAALELVDQIRMGECEMPDRVVVPLGTGGTAAGLALGLKIAGVAIPLIAVRVVPRIVGRLNRVLSLSHATSSLIERLTGETVPRVSAESVMVNDSHYGGAYGRPLSMDRAQESGLRSSGIALDDTYSRKGFATAVTGSQRTLFWLTFDGRLLQD